VLDELTNIVVSFLQVSIYIYNLGINTGDVALDVDDATS
jgi:hypothetical protein